MMLPSIVAPSGWSQQTRFPLMKESGLLQLEQSMTFARFVVSVDAAINIAATVSAKSGIQSGLKQPERLFGRLAPREPLSAAECGTRFRLA